MPRLKHFPGVSPAYHASKVAEQLMPKEHREIKLDVKLVSDVGLG